MLQTNYDRNNQNSGNQNKVLAIRKREEQG
jgi:hypothetical protein